MRFWGWLGLASLVCLSTDHELYINVMIEERNWYGRAWYGMAEVCEGAPVAVSGWVLADKHDLRPCAASSLHRGTTSVSNIMGGTGTLSIAQARN